MGFPGGSVVKNPPAKAGDMELNPELGRSPGGGNGNPFQYSCLENPTDSGAWWATVHRVTMSRTHPRMSENSEALGILVGNLLKYTSRGLSLAPGLSSLG